MPAGSGLAFRLVNTNCGVSKCPQAPNERSEDARARFDGTKICAKGTKHGKNPAEPKRNSSSPVSGNILFYDVFSLEPASMRDAANRSSGLVEHSIVTLTAQLGENTMTELHLFPPVRFALHHDQLTSKPICD
jgi:hypothetical protein